MKITYEPTLEEFNAWSGAEETKNKIIEAGKGDEFITLIEDNFPEGLTETELNDILRFQDEWVFEALGIEVNDNE